ncbi:hypothetical protein P9B03_17235 [Metasolibacillus meyeri]|uniref:TolC family protein n=1 Tax=Metasolibacillus meyeri TaxID=1071052 RepID=A0AAW9NYT0_9BACL|nr:hypothetical protein [Metasolibacillus meyeri]MEC1180250.1 hypothetical protein [Metasolibacillus meyeri]
MRAKFIVIYLCCLYCVFSIAQTVQAEESISIITKDKAIELAIGNHGNVRLLEAKINALQSQKNYIENERDELENIEQPVATILPTNIEFFIEQFPEFDQLADEEKLAVEQLVTTQILINTSLNQLIKGQTAARNQELQEKIKLQREELNKAAIAAEIDKNKNQIDLERTTEAIKYYIAQKYITLLLLEAEIEQFKMEQSYIEKDIQDFIVMKEHGLIHNKDFEKKSNELKVIEEKLNEKERAYQFYMEELKLEIGLPYNQAISLEKVDIAISKLSINELEAKISKMFTVRTMEENIRLNEEQYTNTDSDKTDLKDYYYHSLQATKYEKEVLMKELNAKVKKLDLEQETLFTQIENLQKSKEDLIIDKKDLEAQFEVGLITSIERDKIDRDIQRIESKIDMCKYQYYLLHEKYNRALNGYLL